MKKLIGMLALVMFIDSSSFAIEGIQISTQNNNVVLGWPSVEGETYIVQGRQSLNTNTPWLTLTNYYAAFSGTNWTTFTLTNAFVLPNCSGTGSGGLGGPPSLDSLSGAGFEETDTPSGPPSPWDWFSGEGDYKYPVARSATRLTRRAILAPIW